MTKITLLLQFLILLSCTTTKTTKQNILTNETTINCRLTVSFISIGSGIDRRAMQDFVQFLESFKNERNLKITYERKNWGREGEVDYCLILNELDKKEQLKFINEIKALLKYSKLIRYYEQNQSH